MNEFDPPIDDDEPIIDPDIICMRMALNEAQRAMDEDEVPIGAVIIWNGEIIGKARNQTELLKDPTAHAEILAITQAASVIGDWRLTNTTLYVTKEPCPMCAGAIVQARIPRVVWGVSDPKRGGATSRFKILDCPELNHRPEVETGVCELESRMILQEFFQMKRR